MAPMIGLMPNECCMCQEIVNRYNHGLSHLLKETHQRKAREWFEPLKHGTRIIVVVGGDNFPPKNILEHFFYLSIVTNFVYWEEKPRNVCVIEFLSEKLRNKVMTKTQLRIGESLVLLKMGNKIKEDEWKNLMSGKFTFKEDDDVEFVCNTRKMPNILDTITISDNGMEENVEDLETQMEKIYEENLMPQQEWNFVKSVKIKVEEYLRNKCESSCRLVPFGYGSPRVRIANDTVIRFYFDKQGTINNGLGMWGLGNQVYEKTQGHKITQIQTALAGCVSYVASVGFTIEVIDTTDSQIFFKYSDGTRRAKCKIHFQDFDTLQAHRLLNIYNNMDCRVRPLQLVARQWSRARVWENDMNLEHLQWMVIFFLMRHKILPPVHDLIDYLSIQTDFKLRGFIGFPLLKNDMTLENDDDAFGILKLAAKMFHYYSKFDFSTSLISLNDGDETPKVYSPVVVIQHPLKLECYMTSLGDNSVNLFTKACSKVSNDISKLLLELIVGMDPPPSLSNLLKGIDPPTVKKIRPADKMTRRDKTKKIRTG